MRIPRLSDTPAHSPIIGQTQVTSRQEEGGQTRLALQGSKRPRRAQDAIAVFIPRTLASPSPTFSMSPFIRGFQENMTSWMSRLINQQDGWPTDGCSTG